MKKRITTLASLSTLALAAPALAFAAAVTDVHSLVGKIIGIISTDLVPLVFAIAFLVFLWGAFQTFILGATNDTAKTKGKDLMLYAVIGFFVMVAIWGIVSILTSTLNLSTGVPSLPQTPGQTSAINGGPHLTNG